MRNDKDTITKDYNINWKNIKDHSACSVDNIIINERCYVFTWINEVNSTRNICNMPNSKSVKIKQFPFLKQLFIPLSLQNQIPLLLIENDDFSVYEVTFQNHLSKIRYRYDIVQIDQTKGFYLCHDKKADTVVGLNLFNCSRGGYTLAQNICDGVRDCPNDKSDEENCVCNQTEGTATVCKVTYFGNSRRVCSSLY